MKIDDVRFYNKVALEINAPIYVYYAGRILEEAGITEGTCLDIGCGGGYLGLALARITNLDLIFCDQSADMLRCADENRVARGLSARSRTLQGRVQNIPLDDESVDLVISRGSVPFWEDLPTAFREVRRVLKTGGQAYIGGGLGDPATRAAVRERMRREYPEWEERRHKPPHHDNRHYADGLTAAGIEPFTITRNDEGMWIRFRKA